MFFSLAQVQLKYRFTFIDVESGTVSEIQGSGVAKGSDRGLGGFRIEEGCVSTCYVRQFDVKLYKPSSSYKAKQPCQCILSPSPLPPASTLQAQTSPDIPGPDLHSMERKCTKSSAMPSARNLAKTCNAEPSMSSPSTQRPKCRLLRRGLVWGPIVSYPFTVDHWSIKQPASTSALIC